ncbi:unnamed protein product, partial [marine sediment metagenome]
MSPKLSIKWNLVDKIQTKLHFFSLNPRLKLHLGYDFY